VARVLAGNSDSKVIVGWSARGDTDVDGMADTTMDTALLA
jgi:hypothetical protein